MQPDFYLVNYYYVTCIQNDRNYCQELNSIKIVRMDRHDLSPIHNLSSLTSIHLGLYTFKTVNQSPRVSDSNSSAIFSFFPLRNAFHLDYAHRPKDPV